MILKYIDLDEFVDQGYLQELNRNFLHPLGLALEVVFNPETGKAVSLGRVWDYRDDPEGMCFAEEEINPEKATRIRGEHNVKAETRMKSLGYIIQPAPPLCPRCRVGDDTDGDGNCAYCAHKSDEDLELQGPG